MNMIFKKSLLWMLLTLATASAWAWPGVPDGSQFQRSAVQFRLFGQDQGQAQRQGREPQNQGRRGREGVEPPQQRRDPRENQGAAEEGRGRMTPDERRALRRQINEAGQEIYRPKR